MRQPLTCHYSYNMPMYTAHSHLHTHTHTESTSLLLATFQCDLHAQRATSGGATLHCLRTAVNGIPSVCWYTHTYIRHAEMRSLVQASAAC